ncbi:putative P-type Ca(2+) transporter [Helianthus annuus]|nr:putative P-type Ca(2+) transporter [Helianthus annuus]KAJ0892008.1 putative calcium-transporting ATPase [Helianthus annuus]
MTFISKPIKCQEPQNIYIALIVIDKSVFNEISSREMEKVDVFKGMLKNYVFLGVLTCTVIFQIIIIEYLGTFANTSPLTLPQ